MKTGSEVLIALSSARKTRLLTVQSSKSSIQAHKIDPATRREEQTKLSVVLRKNCTRDPSVPSRAWKLRGISATSVRSSEVSVNSRRGIALAQEFASRRLWGQSGVSVSPPCDSTEAVCLVAMVGLAFEARIAAGPGVFVVCRGEHDASDLLQFAAREGCRCMLSFGGRGRTASGSAAG